MMIGADPASSWIAPDTDGAAVFEFSFREVSKRFVTNDGASSIVALDRVNLDVEAGTFVCLVGPSGCGKSTLLNLATGLLAPDAGSVHCRGAPISNVNQGVGYITQDNTLLPWRTTERNVGLALELDGTSRDVRRRRVDEVLGLVGLRGFEKHYPSQLSGGMQRRALLARTLAYNPRTLLMDEPFGALDAQLRTVLQNELLGLWERDRKTVVFVTHDLEEALLLGDRVVVMGANPGRIVHNEEIPFRRPRNLMELRGSEEFTSWWTRLWHFLKPADIVL